MVWWTRSKFLGFTQVFSYQSTTCVGASMISLHSIKSSLPFSLPLCHVINYSRPSTAFLYSKRWNLGGAWEQGSVCALIALSSSNEFT